MKTVRSLLGIGLALLIAVAATGCKQGLGERCQLDKDCDDGLVCKLINKDRMLGGVCEHGTDTDGGADGDTTD